jgi:hypothetical protein
LSSAAVALGSLRGSNQFEQFMRVVQPLRELVVIFPEGCDSQLGRHAGVLQPGIRGYEADFIDANALRSRKGSLQLESQFGWFGFAGGKSARKAPELFFRHAGKELHAGEACGGEQLGELFFGWGTFQRHAVQ